MDTTNDPEPVSEIDDWKGRVVRLTQKPFEIHKTRHPEFVPYLEAAQQTIRDPDFVTEGQHNANVLFRFNMGKYPYENLYPAVVIYYTNESGKEVTHYFTSTVGDHPIIELRHQWIAGHRFSVGGL